MENETARTGSRCPICRSPTEQAYRPFCSKRCRDVDLARWLGGTYAIPGPTLDEVELPADIAAEAARAAEDDPESR